MGRIVTIVVILWTIGASPVGGQEPSVPAEVEKLIEQLGDDNPQVRQEATERLIVIGMPALEAAKKAAASEDPEVRLRAERIAATITAKNKVTFSDNLLQAYPDIYIEMGKDMSPRGVYNILCRITKNIETVGEDTIFVQPFPKEDGDIAALIILMAERKYEGLNTQEKLAVSRSLPSLFIVHKDKMEDRETIRKVIHALLLLAKDDDDGVRLQAAMALHQIDPREIARMTDDLLPLIDSATIRRKIEESLAFKEPKDLFALLNKGPKELRGSIIDLLATRRAKEYGDELRAELLPLLKDDSWSVRGRAAIALVELGRKADVPAEVISDIKLFTAWNGPPSDRARAVLRELGKD